LNASRGRCAQRAYARIDRIDSPEGFFRRDIGADREFR